MTFELDSAIVERWDFDNFDNDSGWKMESSPNNQDYLVVFWDAGRAKLRHHKLFYAF